MFDFSAKRVKIDPDAGEWVDGFYGHGDTAVRVRPFTYPPFAEAQEALHRKGLDDEAMGEALTGIIAEHLLVDWRLLIADGKGPVEYSPEAVAKYIAAPDAKLKDQAAAVANLIMQASITVMHRQNGVIEAVAKN